MDISCRGARQDHRMAMGTSVYLKLKDGRLISLKNTSAPNDATVTREHLERWRKQGMTLTITDAHGHVEDITPRRVAAIEPVDRTDPQHPT